MIEKIYNLGYLKTEKILLDNYLALDMTLLEANITLIMLELTASNKPVLVSDLIKKTGLESNEVQNILSHLIEKQICDLYIDYEHGLGEEKYSFSGLFMKFEEYFRSFNNTCDNTNVIKRVIDLLEGELKRTLTALELEAVSSWLNNEGYTYDDIKSAVLKQTFSAGRFSIKNVNRYLVGMKEEKFSNNGTVDDSADGDLLRKFYSEIKR